MNDCEGMTSRGRIYWCSRAIAADELDYYPNPKSNEYVDVRNTPVEELGEKLEQFYSLKCISTCNYCDGINGTVPIVPTAAQIVNKSIALQLFSYVDALKNADNVQRVVVVQEWLKYISNNFKALIYERNLKVVLEETLELYEKYMTDGLCNDNLADRISVLWNLLVDEIFKKYSFSVDSQIDTVPDSAIKKYNCFVKKNTISVLLINDETAIEDITQSVDIILTISDIQKERDWERNAGEKSAVRNFLLLDQL